MIKIRQFLRCLILPGVFIACLVVGSGCFGQKGADAILGEWYSPEKDGKFLFYKNNGRYYGKLVWLSNPLGNDGKPKKDLANPDPAKRHISLIGLNVFSGFIYNAEKKEWTEGKVYDTRHGDTYCCTLRLISDLVLETRGFVMYSWLGKSAYFTRNK